MFSDRIDILMKKIGATNTEIAALAGVDRTNLSNFRSGKIIVVKSNFGSVA